MKYPTHSEIRTQAQIQQLTERIAKLQKQNRMLQAGGIEAVIGQNYNEIRQLQAMLEELKGDDTDDTTSDKRSP